MDIDKIPSTREFEELVRTALVENMHKELDGRKEQIRYINEKYKVFIDIIQNDILNKMKNGERFYRFFADHLTIGLLSDLLNYSNHRRLIDIATQPFKDKGYNIRLIGNDREILENLNFNDLTWTINLGW